MQLITDDLFSRFPTLKFVIPHGGGAVPYHWGRYRGLAQDMGIESLKDRLIFVENARKVYPRLSLAPKGRK